MLDSEMLSRGVKLSKIYSDNFLKSMEKVFELFNSKSTDIVLDAVAAMEN